MASISSLTGSSSSSIYGTRNVISGLASGLDTEALIENAVSGYKNKITSLQQQRTKVGWQQDAYRSMINKMVSFTQKYTSYTSSTNLLSSTFFDSAVNVKALGDNAGKVSASGKSSSNVVVNEIKSLAKAASYTTEGALQPSGEAVKSFGLNDKTAVGKLSGTMTLGYGGRTVQISFDETDIFNNDLDAQRNEIQGTGIQKMVDAINKKLEEETVAFDGGNQAKASERIKAVVDGDSIKFEAVDKTDTNSIWISDVSTSIQSALDIEIPKDDKEKKTLNSFDFNSNIGSIVDTNKTMLQLIKDKGFTVTVNGSSQTIKITDQDIANADADDDDDTEQKLINALNNKLNSKDVEFYDAKDGAGVQIGFRVKKGVDKNNVTFQVTSAAAEQLGMEGGLTSYVNTNRKLGDLIGAADKQWNSWRLEVEDVDANKLKESGTAADGKTIYKTADGLYIKKDGSKYYQTNSIGEYYYDIKINGDTAAIVTKETTLDELLNRINNSDTSKITASYSKFTGKFTFTAKDSGANSDVSFEGLMGELFYAKSASLIGESLKNDYVNFEIDGVQVQYQFKTWNPDMETIAKQLNEETALKDSGYTAEVSKEGYLVLKDGNGMQVDPSRIVYHTEEKPALPDYKEDGKKHHEVGKKLFDQRRTYGTYTPGQDAEFTVTVNGQRMEGLKRSTNTIDIDGMSLTLKGTFDKEEGKEVTFQTEADSDKIVDAVKQMVNDFNTLAKEVKDAYSTIPLQRSNGKYYEPLTEEDQAEMSESAIKAYEEKAKTGLLFADRDLSSLYDGLRNALSQLGVSGNDATKLGITASYSDGLTTISLDESALRNALNSNPDKVKDLFTKSKSNGSSSDGLMQGIKNVMDKYAGTTGSVKGILVEKAGSPLAPTSIYKNAIQTQLDNLDKQIEKWQDRISDQIDYYTTKFTALEKMMAQMNDQSSMLMGFAGGY